MRNLRDKDGRERRSEKEREGREKETRMRKKMNI